MKKLKQLLAAALAVVMLVSAAPSVFAAGEISADTPLIAPQAQYATRGEVADMLLAAADDYNPEVKRTDIIKGYPNGDLDEGGSITRVQALVMLSRAFGDLPTPVGNDARNAYEPSNFTDVPAWAQEQLVDVFEAGIVAGTSATTLSPNDYVTVEQMNLFIDRVYTLEGSNLKDDFYATVNKEALDSSVILPGYSAAGGFTDLAITVNNEVAGIIRDIIANGGDSAGEKKIAALYNNIIDLDARNKAGIDPVKPYLDAIDSASNVAELMAVHNKMTKELGATLLLSFSLTSDALDSNVYDLAFGSIGPTLGQGGYAGATDAQKAAYLTYCETLFTLLGESADAARTEAQLVWDTDCALAAVALTNQEQADIDKTFNIYSMAQLRALFPNVDLDAVFALTGLKQTDKIIVSDVKLLEEAAKYFDDAHLDVLKAYMRLSVGSGLGSYLSEDFYDAGNAFNAQYAGIAGALPMEDYAAQVVQAVMSAYIGQAYVDSYFSAEAKADVEGIVYDMLDVYKDRINALDWMSAATKAKAVNKLSTMKVNIGYPDTFEDVFADAKILPASEGGNYFDNMVAIMRCSSSIRAKRQSEGVDKSAWLMTPDTVNACYDPNANSITFPAAILQAPFYDMDASYEKNLGGIGYVIAHEITHAFDNNGAKYDEKGNATDWWTESDYIAFSALCDDVVELYDGVEFIPGVACNGSLTLSENIADLGSMACLIELESRQAKPDYAALFTAAAQIWCSSCSRAMNQYLSFADVHAPDKLRGSVVLQQFDEFYDTFDIEEGDGMYLAPESRVTIW